MVIGKLGQQSESYLRWIINNFKAKDWAWVDSAKSILHKSSSLPLQFTEPDILLLNAEPSTSVYGSLLKKCTEQRDLQAGKRVHAHIVHNGYARDGYVGNLLIQMYGKCRRTDLARFVFDAMLNRDLFSWNIMISAYAQNGHLHEAIAVFNMMERSSVQPDVFVFASILGVYARSGRMDHARKVFDGMSLRDSGSWTAMISAYAQNGEAQEAIDLFRRMDHQGFPATRLTFVSVLGACGSLGDLKQGKTVYERFVQRGYQTDLVMESALLNLYSKSGNVEDAEEVFHKMEEKDVASWTNMIEAYARHGLGDEGILTYKHMLLEGMVADAITFVAVLGACSVSNCIQLGKKLHRLVHVLGLETNLKVETAVLHMYGRCGSVEDARQVFDSIRSRDIIAWNAMLRALARHERFTEALELYHSMLNSHGMVPDEVTYGTLLTTCCSFEALDHARRMHAHLNASSGLRLQIEMHTLLLNMYAKCGSIEEAREVFDRMPAWNLTTCNAIIVWYTRYGIPREAYLIFTAMLARGLEPDVVTCIGGLTACSSLGFLEAGRRIHARMKADRLLQPEGDVVVWTTLVNMYSKCGGVSEARGVFEEMAVKNVVSYNTMIAAYAQLGDIEEVEELYRGMVCLGLEADVITLLCMLIGCNHAGMDKHGRDVFVRLRGDHEGIVPILDHYHSLVDLLSRAGRLEEAEELLCLMPFQPGAVGWKSLLNGCAVHGEPERGARAAVNACRLDPGDSSQYVLLSNVVAWFGKHNKDVSEVVKAMEKALDRYNQGEYELSHM